MGPSSGENKSFELAKPLEQESEAGVDAKMENLPVASPEKSAQSQAAQAAAQVAVAVSDQVAPKAVPDDNSSTLQASDNSQQVTDDKSLNKESMQQAKQIIAKTKDDPFEQKQQISKFKADYIQKRFKTTIRTDDSVAA